MSRRAHRAGPTTAQRHFDAPLTIGVISDTHIYAHGSREIHPAILRLFRRAGVDLIVHLGDINTRHVLDELSEIAPIIAVVGNNDDEDLQYTLPLTTRFTVGRYSFAAVHGHGGRTARDEAIRRWAGKVDCVLFGHSHKPLMEKVGETLLFNPGSATDRRWNPHFGIGLITVEDDGLTPDLIVFTNPEHLDNVAVGDEPADGSHA
ncbi:MAG TPA: metallophosphoesterase family protein [Thermomicrobiales bacterium]|nr:metallophosphoesterase family protein [Thermomicrobiales bacterium]